MAIINIQGLAKRYGIGDAETAALRGVSLSVDVGEFVAVMGPSGSGKSTLLHILGLLDQPTAGTYRFDGKDIGTYSEDDLAHLRNARMGFVFQQFHLLARTTVLENVMLPLMYSAVPEREWVSLAQAAITRVGLAHRATHTPAQLSGGEQQRVAIARALIRDPAVIFADEPTGNLDSQSGRMVMELFAKLHADQRHTIILITHDPTVGARAGRLIRLRDGELQSDARTADLPIAMRMLQPPNSP